MTQTEPKPLTPLQSRKALDLTQAEAAERCKVSLRTWKNWEAAGEIPSSKREFAVSALTPSFVELPRFQNNLDPSKPHIPRPAPKPAEPEPERYRGMIYEDGVHKRFIDGEWRVVPFPKAPDPSPEVLAKRMEHVARMLKS